MSNDTSLQVEALPARRLSRPVRITAAILFTVWTVDYIDRLVLTIVLPQIGQEFGLSNAQKGLLVSAFFLTYTLAQIPGGLVTDKLGGRRVAAAATLTWSVFTAFTGLVHSYGLLLAVRALFGLAQAPFPAAATRILAERTKPSQRMSAQGVVASSGGFGSLIGYLTIPALVVAIGWRHAFLGMAFVGVICFFLLFLLPPKLTEAETDRAAPTDTASTPAPREVWRKLLLNRTLLTFTAMFFGSNLITWGVMSWVPSYLQEVRGITLANSTVLLALPAITMSVGIYLGGRITDRLNGATAKIVAPAMIVAAASIFVVALTESLPLFLVFECIAVFGCGLCTVPVVSVPLKALPTKLSGSAYSAVNFGGQLAGVVAPMAMGVLLDHFGYTAAFMFLSTGAVIAVIFAIAAPQTPDAFIRRARINAPARPMGVDK
ncbi:MFS transporter [Rhodococcus qingshengii]|uniref:MFS transporter n=1 Tax=Rhodococcus qingshengii TaxID=334542 RepID=UPI0035FDE7AF